MTYYVGSDNIDGNEQSYIDAVVSALNNAGKDAQSVGVGPNKESVRNSKGAGDTLVFIVGGGAAGCTLASFVKSVEGTEDHAYTIFGYAGWTGNEHVTCEAAQTEQLVKEHDCNFYQSWMPSYYEGHTMVTFCEKYSDILSVCCSDESAEDLGEKIANGGCGTDSSDEEGSSASTIKDAIKEVMGYWDGEAELFVRNDEIHIRQVLNPNAEGNVDWALSEGINIVSDSLSITDINPDTVNFLTVHWNGGDDIVLRDEKLIERFGEKPKEMEATKYVATTEEEESSDTSTDTTSTTDTDTTTTTGEDESSDTTTTTGEEEEDTGGTETKTVTSVQEVPVETYDEALVFAYREWGKIKRDDGHTIEAKVVADEKWETGKWVAVHIPSFDEDEKYMYITKVSHSEDDGWECNVTLADYPPGFGDPPSTDDSEDEETTEEETSDETETTDEESA